MALDKLKYVNTKTWEIEDCPTDYIPCDKEISYVIMLLNKKGYKTFSSCAGHDEVWFSESICDIRKLEEAQKSPFYKITKIKPKSFYSLKEIVTTTTYICFIEGADYQFDNCPEGFKISKSRIANRISISKHTNLYNSNNQRRSHEEIEKELQKGWKALIKWAINLKENK